MKNYEMVPIGAPPVPARSGGGVTKVKDSAAYKAVANQAEKASLRLKAANKELNQEPERAAIGVVLGSLGGGLALNQMDKMAAEKPDGILAKNPNAALVGVGVLGLAGAWGAASQGMPTVMHGALSLASTAYGAGIGANFKVLGRPAPAAVPAPAPATAPKIQGGSDPFDVGAGPLSRAFARRLARQAGTEQPSTVEGPDTLESYVGEILEDSGVAGVLDGELEVGALPLMLAPAALQQLLAMLPAMKAAAQAEQAGKPGPAVNGGVCWPMLADLSGLDGDVGATMAERQYRRQQRRIKRQERRLAKAKAKAAASPAGQQAAQAAELQALRAQVQQLQAQQAQQAAYVPAEAATEEYIPVEA